MFGSKCVWTLHSKLVCFEHPAADLKSLYMQPLSFEICRYNIYMYINVYYILYICTYGIIYIIWQCSKPYFPFYQPPTNQLFCNRIVQARSKPLSLHPWWAWDAARFFRALLVQVQPEPTWNIGKLTWEIIGLEWNLSSGKHDVAIQNASFTWFVQL